MLTQAETSKRTEKGLPDWFVPWRFATLLGLLIFACFPLVLLGVKTFAYLDFGQFAYPVAFYHRESFWRGELPFWNPLSNCGVPFLAQWNTLTLYPLSLVYLLLPFPWSLGVFCLLHLFLAGMGMYFLAHRWTGNRLAGAVAGAVFAFNGMSWYGLIWPHITAGLAWTPWVVLGIGFAWQDGGRWIIWAALAAAMQLLSGGAEVVLLTWLLLAVLGIAEVIAGPVLWAPGRPSVPERTGSGLSGLRAAAPLLIGRGLGVVVLAAGLAAVQLLPFIDLLAHSQRTSGYADPHMGVMPGTGWANYLVPIFRCLLNPQGLYVPPNHWTGSYYVGIGTVLLASVAVWRARDRTVWTLFALVLFGMVMALGAQTPIYGAVNRVVPVLGMLRFPVKFVILATFILPLLAARGLAWLEALPAEKWPMAWRTLKGLAFCLAVLMGLILWFAWTHPLEPGHFPATVLNAVVRAVFLGLAVGCVVLLRRKSGWKPQALLQTGLVLVLWFDVLTHNSNLSPTVSPAVMQADVIRQYFQWGNDIGPGASRIMQSTDSYRKMLAVGFRNLELDTNGRRLAQFFDFNLLDHAPKVDGFYSLDLKEFADVFDQLYHGTNRAEPLKDFLAVSRSSNPANIVDWVPRASSLPLINAGQKPLFAGPAETMQALLSDNFEPSRFVYLPLEAQGKLRATGAAKARIGRTTFSAHRVAFEVESDGPAVVTAAQAFYHPWHAYVDDQRTPLWRANYAFQALEVPAGRHEVILAYEDPFFFWGTIVSLVSLAICVASRPWRAVTATYPLIQSSEQATVPNHPPIH